MVHGQHGQHDQRDQRVGGTPVWTRRACLGAAFAGSVAAPVWARQQDPQIPPYEPRDWSGQDPVSYPDRDIIALDLRFRRYVLVNTPITRLHVGRCGLRGLRGTALDAIWSGATFPTTASEAPGGTACS